MKIKPAPLTDDIDDLRRQLGNAEKFTDEVDIDIVDWDRTDFKTISVDLALEIKSSLKFNFDLMMDEPSKSIESLLEDERVENIVLNIRAKENLVPLVQMIQKSDKKTLISFDSPAEYEALEELLPIIEGVQIFTVTPGSQGNPFKQEMLDFAERLRKSRFVGEIGIDGGVNLNTLPIILEHDVDYASVGSAISKSSDPEFAFRQLEELVHTKELE